MSGAHWEVLRGTVWGNELEDEWVAPLVFPLVFQ